MDTQNQQLREITKAVLDLVGELRKGTINKVLGMSDLALGVQTLLGTPLSGKTVHFYALGPSAPG
jgi:hypothetical protein